MEGWDFFVNLVDAHTFDVIVDITNYTKKLRYIGDKASLPQDEVPISQNFPPLFTNSYFINGPFEICVRGITIYEDEPCVFFDFTCKESKVHFETNINKIKAVIDGISNYHGKIFLSLEGNKILWGEITERVDLLTFLPSFKTKTRNVVCREITLERIKKSDFEQTVH